MAKPITRGPSAPSTTCSGPSSPCTSPAWCTAARPVAMPIASASSSSPSRGPSAATTSDSSGPGLGREPVPGGTVRGPLGGEHGDHDPVAIGSAAKVGGAAAGYPGDASGQPVAPDALWIVGSQWRDLGHASSPRGPAWQDVRFVPYALCAGERADRI